VHWYSLLTEPVAQKVDMRREGTGLPSDGIGDIMAHQLKFIACIKIMVDELSTLATGFEVDGGQLRYQLYIWLEKEVEVLKRLSSYGMDGDPHRDSSHGKTYLLFLKLLLHLLLQLESRQRFL